VDDDIEVVQEDDSVSVANVEPTFWEYQVLLSLSAAINSQFKQSALIAIFNG
jgi:hypothetical protein